jgi:drug/metabolite transporter (DMT)-like permease
MQCLWLLQWAGVIVRRPVWDRWLLIAAALLLMSSVATAALLAGTEPWTPFRWAGVGAVYIVVLILLYYASRRIEEWQLRRNIEPSRLQLYHRHLNVGETDVTH